jgi:hypothetical protein
MVICNLIAAIALLTANPSYEGSQPKIPAPMRAEIKRLALKWEILDPRECRYIMQRTEESPADLNLLRRRWRELRDAPSLSDAQRFPQRFIVNDLLSANRDYQKTMTLRQMVDGSRWEENRVILGENDQLYAIWDNVRDAGCEYYYVVVRRLALKRLREQLGDEAYYSGDLPPSVPLWRFAQAD